MVHHESTIAPGSPRDLAEEPSPAICYAAWTSRIQTAWDLDRLGEAVRDYLASWRREELAMLPAELASLVLDRGRDIAGNAAVASRLECGFEGSPRARELLREMALTLRAAAARYRFLTALRAREVDGAGHYAKGRRTPSGRRQRELALPEV